MEDRRRELYLANMAELQEMVDEIDDDQSGSIEFNEFLVMMSKHRQTRQEIKMEEMMEAVK